MPTYEYACKACGEHLEVVQSFKDSALTECPACGGTLRKVFGNIGVAFKGSGFYRTDSRSDGRRGGQKAAAEAKAADVGGSKGAEGTGSGGVTEGAKGSKATGAGVSSATSSGVAAAS